MSPYKAENQKTRLEALCDFPPKKHVDPRNKHNKGTEDDDDWGKMEREWLEVSDRQTDTHSTNFVCIEF